MTWTWDTSSAISLMKIRHIDSVNYILQFILFFYIYHRDYFSMFYLHMGLYLLFLLYYINYYVLRFWAFYFVIFRNAHIF